jgi:hypothetical protein
MISSAGGGLIVGAVWRWFAALGLRMISSVYGELIVGRN